MATVAMPQLGESVAEGTVVRWLKSVGESVRVDEPLFEVSTDKVNTEIPSLEAGVLSEILVAEGETVPVGTVLARIGGAVAAKASALVANGARANLFSPVVRRLAREHNVDLSKVAGTGGGGRVTRDDVLAFAGVAVAGLAVERERAAPAASQVKPTPPAPAPRPSGGSDLRGRTVPMPLMRSQIAERLTASRKNSVDVFSAIEVDMERVVAVRSAHKVAFAEREGFALTYLPFIARAVVDALAAYPALNSRIDFEQKTVTYHAAIHLGIAVDLDEQGLLVPVIRDADAMNVVGIARRIHALSGAARAGTIAAADVSGSTFSISNNGAFGTLLTAPVINAPNVAILSTDVIEQRAAVVDGALMVRFRTNLCMTWDHRAMDGATAGKFLARVKHDLESWDWETQLT
jgi:2-oxoglutarate dehydrogenase E2 component (dihydrolipoamide succinyltransferase)